MLSHFYQDFIPVLLRFYPGFPGFIKILSRFYPSLIQVFLIQVYVKNYGPADFFAYANISAKSVPFVKILQHVNKEPSCIGYNHEKTGGSKFS